MCAGIGRNFNVFKGKSQKGHKVIGLKSCKLMLNTKIEARWSKQYYHRLVSFYEGCLNRKGILKEFLNGNHEANFEIRL